MGPKTKKPRTMAGLVNGHKKPGSLTGLLKVSWCVHSNTLCYKNTSIPRGKVLRCHFERLHGIDYHAISLSFSLMLLCQSLYSYSSR
jgi:hypothetical protein